MDRLHAMQVFVKVADNAGFAGAARQLRMSPPAVTRAIAALEDAIGTRLFVRTTRSVKLTEAGTRYLGDCRRILADIAEAESAAAGAYGKPLGTLCVTASMLFGQIYVLPILQEYLDRYPDVLGHTLFLDRVTNIVEEGIDVAVRIGQLPDSSHAAIRVGTVRRVVCGSPEYFSREGVPERPADLAHHRVIAATGGGTSLEWHFGSRAGPAQRETVPIRPALFCNTNAAAICAARSGWGLTRLLSYQIGPDLEQGTLCAVLRDFEEDPLPVHVIHPEGRRASAKVRAFVDLAVERLRANRLIN